MKKLLALFVVILGFTAVSFGQLTNSATATASGIIEAPLTIENKGNMDFGKIYAASTNRDLILSPSNARSGTAGFNATSTAAAAQFDVIGTVTTAYNITLPSAAVSTITMPSGATAMTVDTWTCNTVVTAGNTGSTGTQRITVGATLHLGVAQTPGLYTTAPFTVTVNYN